MENHPIPQDITGFKFKLIGSITVKQFLYLIVPAILSYIVFASPIIHPILKIPLIFFFAGTGIAITFVPIDGRPMDTMFFHFLKAIPSENQYIYQKKGAPLFSDDLLPKKSVVSAKRLQEQERERLKKRMFLNQLFSSYPEPDKAEVDFFNKIKSFFDQIALATDINVQYIPTLTKKDLTESQATSLQPKAEEAQSSKIPPQYKVEQNLEIPISESQIHKAAKEKAEQEFKKEKKQVELSIVKRITPTQQIAAGFPTLPDKPNVILGKITDPRGKALQNILVEVLDKDNNPVRAFKTNLLGQFISATPLPNGLYKIILTDQKKQHGFDRIEVNLNGEIFAPLEIISMDERERLRRELFEN